MLYRGYGQYCPLALAAEILCDRWTMLIVSRLFDGCTRFNEIHRGVPRISASLLSLRLEQLQDAGVLVRYPLPVGRGYSYQLTDAGRDLDPIIRSMSEWGQRWARDMRTDDLDTAFLAWSMHKRINIDAMPLNQTVLEFEFSAKPDSLEKFWLVVQEGRVDMCLKNPGYEADVKVSADLQRFVEAWRGFRPLQEEIANGHIRLEGSAAVCSALPDWLMLCKLADIPRASGHEASIKNDTERPAAEPVL